MPEMFMTPAKRVNHYAVLGVAADATDTEIKKAYRKLAFAHHPDKNPGNVQSATEKFTEVKEAYEVLNDPEQRRKYDKEIGRYCLKSSSSFPVYEAPPKRHQSFDGTTRSHSKSRESYPPSTPHRSSSKSRDPFSTSPTTPPPHARRSSSKSRSDPFDIPRASTRPRADTYDGTPVRSSPKVHDPFGMMNTRVASSKRRESFDAVPTRRSSSRCRDAEQIRVDPELDRARHLAAERAKALWERRQREAAERIEAERREAEVRQAELREAERKEAERREHQRRDAEKREAQWREEEAKRTARKAEQEKRQMKREAREAREARQKELERKDAERRQAEYARRAAERKEAGKIDLERGEVDRRQQIIQSIMIVQAMISDCRREVHRPKSKSWARYRSEDELWSYLRAERATLVEILQEEN